MRRRGSRMTGKNDPFRSFGIRSSTSPAWVASNRSRAPLRSVVLVLVRSYFPAPISSVASASISSCMTIRTDSRTRSTPSPVRNASRSSDTADWDKAVDFRADDCTVVVSDGSTLTETVTLDGCTPTPVTPPAAPPATGDCKITPGVPATVHAGDLSTYYMHTTGCDTGTGPVQWAFVAGRVPVGMTGPSTQGQDAGAVSGRPTVEGSYSFQMQVTDTVGATNTETFDITVLAPRPVTVTTLDLAPGAVGRSYWVNLRAD